MTTERDGSARTDRGDPHGRGTTRKAMLPSGRGGYGRLEHRDLRVLAPEGGEAFPLEPIAEALRESPDKPHAGRLGLNPPPPARAGG